MPSTITIRVTPRSSRNAIEVDGEAIKVWVSAPPADGQANDAVCKLLAKALGIAPSKLSIVKGESSRDKTIQVQILSRDEVFARLAASSSS
jgi:uncharacterized protein (TIGR00251 family)